MIQDLEDRGLQANEDTVWLCPSYAGEIRGKMTAPPAAPATDPNVYDMYETFGSTMMVTGMIRRPYDNGTPGTNFGQYQGMLSPNQLEDLTGPMVGDYIAYLTGYGGGQGWHSNHGSTEGVATLTTAAGTLETYKNPLGANMVYSDGHGSFDTVESMEQNFDDQGMTFPVQTYINYAQYHYGFLDELRP